MGSVFRGMALRIGISSPTLDLQGATLGTEPSVPLVVIRRSKAEHFLGSHGDNSSF